MIKIYRIVIKNCFDLTFIRFLIAKIIHFPLSRIGLIAFHPFFLLPARSALADPDIETKRTRRLAQLNF